MADTADPIRLAIVDDHRMLLGALSEWLRGASSESEIELVAAVPSWSELLAHPDFPVDVVLLDLDLRDNIPISLKLSMLKSAGVKTMLMSNYSEAAVVREALSAGALGYLVKSEPVESIIEAIRAAGLGDSYLTPELEHALLDDGTVPKLSAQERRVMALYGAGQPVKAVAFQLGISEETAKSYLKRIREKYRASGYDVGTKVALRKRAILDGILLQSD
ncbi:MAG TPA: response regulator transcription factor [Microbacterium sp.]|jgi:two-component system uhpT operon response regulator UhpA|nr:response regulator transcription factor [Microbacterium sp.]